jgi:hypothetical protein
MQAEVTVIIPTLCLAERRESLFRAMNSIQDQPGVRTRVIAVVNGNRADPCLLEDLHIRPGVRVARIEEASVSGAQMHGRQLVESKVYAFLDDDDMLLPGTLQPRVEALFEREADLLVTNGYRGDGSLVCDDPDAVNSDPIDALLRQNWLASCAGTFRASSIGPEWFGQKVRYGEWTLLAFKLANAAKRIYFWNVPAYRISETPVSASKALSYELFSASVDILNLICATAPARHRREVRRKLAATLHEAAHYCASQGKLSEARKLYLRAMACGEWKYLLYARHLLTPAGRSSKSPR